MMSGSRFIILSVCSPTLFVLVLSEQALAECNPKDFLVQVSETSYSDVRTAISILDSLDRDRRSSAERASRLDIPGYLGASDSDKRQNSDRLKQLSKLDYSHQEMDYRLVEKLDPGGISAYTACLNSANEWFSLTVSPNASSMKEFSLFVHSHPQRNTDANVKVKIEVDTPSTTVNCKKALEDAIPFNTSKSFKIRRKSAFEDVSLNVSVDGEIKPLFLYGKPRFRVAYRTARSEIVKAATGWGGKDRFKIACVNLGEISDDAVLMKGTMAFVHVNQDIRGRGYADDCQNTQSRLCQGKKHTESASTACATIMAHVSDGDSASSFEGYLSVRYAIKVPNN